MCRLYSWISGSLVPMQTTWLFDIFQTNICIDFSIHGLILRRVVVWGNVVRIFFIIVPYICFYVITWRTRSLYYTYKSVNAYTSYIYWRSLLTIACFSSMHTIWLADFGWKAIPSLLILAISAERLLLLPSTYSCFVGFLPTVSSWFHTQNQWQAYSI